jgi:alanyl-tRNA synthetase
MTDRLYYTDPYLREFDATVVSVDERDGRTLVVLDRTAFYPTSGGQPFDVGTIGARRVLDVIDEDDGSILHVTAGSGVSVGEAVHAEIDWPRRFDHMQQHSGQHVLSAAFDRLFGVRTVSFHLGAATSTIDLAREASAREIAAAEDEANRIVWEDRPVSIRFATAEEAAAMPLRKETARGGTLRLIDVDGFDLSACGGTHVARTGAIGIIAVAAWERFKDGQRVEFLCGARALGRFRSLRDTADAAGRLLSVGADELPATIERMQAEAKDHRRVASGLQTELARYRAEGLAAAAVATGRTRLVARAVDADANGLKALAAAIVAGRPGLVVVLVSTTRPALAVVARSADLDLQANQILGALTTRFGGRGGGKSEMAQGGGLDAPAEDILAAARAAVALSRDV